MTQIEAPLQAGISGGRFWRAFLVIGLLSFGGPAGQIATMHRELVEKRGWIDDATFLRALNFCMLLPGPEAQQLATWCGWRLRGVRGGLVAGLLFIGPGALVMAVLAAIYLGFGELGAVKAVFGGVQAAVLAIVAQSLKKVAGRALGGRSAWGLAIAAFASITLLDMPFPLVIALAGTAGWWMARDNHARAEQGRVASGEPPGASWAQAGRTALMWLGIWLAPLALALALPGAYRGLADLGCFFARLALFSFGGAYAGLAYVAQGAAAGHGWVQAREIVDGLALAETTPGPLVLVYQFVGALAGNRLLPGWGGAALGMAMVLWMTFAPSFMFIFALAPKLERLMARPALASALGGVSAAVVGVIASLALWFGLHALFASVTTMHWGPLQLWRPMGMIDPFKAGLALVALALLLRSRLGMLPVLGLAALAGLARWWLNNS